MTHLELKEALGVFGWSERDALTLAQVKRRHRDLAKGCHPDLKGERSSVDMQRLNAAAAILLAYLNSYRCSFTEEEFYFQNPDERLRMQFANDPVWGGS
jgi:hypothetical protein